MTDNQYPDIEATGYTPDFELPRQGAIREDNWAKYEARGFRTVPEPFDGAQMFYGIPNVYSGDAYDHEAGRPLRHKPGTSVYVSPEGFEYRAELMRRFNEALGRHQESSGKDPAAS